ncbi:DUF1636 family protein [Roseibium sp. CAU 1637]|uniref:DUF1636 family protein n=2 Tax=Stappiaceae TaxID=2821832 RepID=A0A939EQJ5_9HYPH|nr:DUF1636 family protein [Roseibium limicola]
MPVYLHLCSTCDAGRSQEDLMLMQRTFAQARLPRPVTVLTQPCMNVCSEPVTLSLQGQGLATCIFSGVQVEKDIDDLVATVRCWVEAPAGWIDNALACGRLRFCLKARVPALPEAR